MEVLLVEPYHFRGRRGLGSECRRLAARRAFRSSQRGRNHRADVRPRLQGLRAYTQSALFALRPLALSHDTALFRVLNSTSINVATAGHHSVVEIADAHNYDIAGDDAVGCILDCARKQPEIETCFSSNGVGGSFLATIIDCSIVSPPID